MKYARDRLDFFVKHPEKHTQHAVKVLLKFKLLESQYIEEALLLVWAANTPLVKHLHAHCWPDEDFDIWIHKMCDQLVNAYAARRVGTLLVNQ